MRDVIRSMGGSGRVEKHLPTMYNSVDEPHYILLSFFSFLASEYRRRVSAPLMMMCFSSTSTTYHRLPR